MNDYDLSLSLKFSSSIFIFNDFINPKKIMQTKWIKYEICSILEDIFGFHSKAFTRTTNMQQKYDRCSNAVFDDIVGHMQTIKRMVTLRKSSKVEK